MRCVMETVKNSAIVRFLHSTDFKSKCIKLAILLCFMILGFVAEAFIYIAFASCVLYVLFEYSADSLFWIIIAAVYMPYDNASLTFILMWMLSAILLIKLIIDLKNKRINFKSWYLITIISLFGAICLMVLLPLSKTYKFGSQLNKFALFSLVVLGLIYIKEIKVKNMLLLFASAVAILGLMYYVFTQCNIITTGYMAKYSKGQILRFSPFSNDPNFSGAILICAIMAWFIAYKKEFINKYIYFGGMTIGGILVLMTISKATYFIIALFGLYVLIENIVITIKTKNAKHLLELVYYLGALLIASIICWKYIDSMYQRIFNPSSGWWNEGKQDAGLSNLTTGRTDLWIAYLKVIFNSPQILLFGAGADADYIGNGAAHSMPLDYLYRYGILTVIVLVALFIVAVLPYLKKTKPYNFVPLICITGIFCSIGSVSAKYIYIFTIMFITLSCNSLNNLQVSTDEIITNNQTLQQKKIESN